MQGHLLLLQVVPRSLLLDSIIRQHGGAYSKQIQKGRPAPKAPVQHTTACTACLDSWLLRPVPASKAFAAQRLVFPCLNQVH